MFACLLLVVQKKCIWFSRYQHPLPFLEGYPCTGKKGWQLWQPGVSISPMSLYPFPDWEKDKNNCKKLAPPLLPQQKVTLYRNQPKPVRATSKSTTSCIWLLLTITSQVAYLESLPEKASLKSY